MIVRIQLIMIKSDQYEFKLLGIFILEIDVGFYISDRYVVLE